MKWLREHPFSIMVWTAIVLVLVGLYFVEEHRAVAPNGSNGTWNTEGVYVEPTVTTAVEPSTPPLPPLTENDTPDVPLPVKQKPVATTTQTRSFKSEEAFDFNALLSQLKHDSPVQGSGAKNVRYEDLLGAFSSVSQPPIVTPPAHTRTAEQQALFTYGNTIGGQIQAFRGLNPGKTQTETLSEQIAHRNDPSANNAVRDLGARYHDFGESILAIHDVPASVESAHAALGNSYINLGDALSKVPDATTDQSFIAAITAYNAKSEAFTNAFTGLATLFSLSEVTFEETDAGSVFSFRKN